MKRLYPVLVLALGLSSVGCTCLKVPKQDTTPPTLSAVVIYKDATHQVQSVKIPGSRKGTVVKVPKWQPYQVRFTGTDAGGIREIWTQQGWQASYRGNVEKSTEWDPVTSTFDPECPRKSETVIENIPEVTDPQVIHETHSFRMGAIDFLGNPTEAKPWFDVEHIDIPRPEIEPKPKEPVPQDRPPVCRKARLKYTGNVQPDGAALLRYERFLGWGGRVVEVENPGPHSIVVQFYNTQTIAVGAPDATATVPARGKATLVDGQGHRVRPPARGIWQVDAPLPSTQRRGGSYNIKLCVQFN